MRDTHAQPSNLQYAPDNHIWGVVGYSGFDGQMNGKRMQFSQGIYRFKPDGSDFEFVTGSTNNTWGLGFSETFDAFGSTANNDPSFYMAIPNRYFTGDRGAAARASPATRPLGPGYQSLAAFYAVHPVTPYIRQVDVHGGYTAAAGHHLYTARAFPKEYWNRVAFITEPTAHLVGQGILEKQGAGFVTRDGWNLMAGSEEWVAPVHAQVGPDGAVWVADWYNFIAQHNPTPHRLQQRQGERRTSRRCAITCAAGSTASRIATRRRRSAGRCRRPIPRGWSRRCRPTTCSGGSRRSVCSSSAGRRTSCLSSSRSSAIRPSTRLASAAVRCTRSGRSTGSAPWPGPPARRIVRPSAR